MLYKLFSDPKYAFPTKLPHGKFDPTKECRTNGTTERRQALSLSGIVRREKERKT